MAQITTDEPIQSWQRQLIIFAWFVYAILYFGRVNVSAALPDIGADLNIGKDLLGLFGTGFFITYALGTLINGRLGDLLSPKRVIFWGLVGSALLNLAFGLTNLFWALLTIWCLNGLFQSTGWGPVLRLLSNWLTPDQRRRISGVFASNFVAGNAGAWLLTGWVITRFNWHVAFWISAIILGFSAIFWHFTIHDDPAEAGYPSVNPIKTTQSNEAVTLKTIFQGLNHNFQTFWPLAIAAFGIGFCLVALFIWTPTYFFEEGGLTIGQSANVSTLIPIAGILGTILIGWYVGKFQKENESYSLMIVMLGLAGLYLLQLTLPQNLLVNATIFMIIGGLIYGATSLLLSVLPMTLGNQAGASSLAGHLDFFTSMGGSLSGWGVGIILENANWNSVFIVFSAVSLFSAFFIFVSQKRNSQKDRSSINE